MTTVAEPEAEEKVGADWKPMAHILCHTCHPEGEKPEGVCGAEMLGIPVGNSDYDLCQPCEEAWPEHFIAHFTGRI